MSRISVIPTNPPPTEDAITGGIIRTFRQLPPSHYTWKIESFSILLESGVEKVESGLFEADGHKWKMTFYPGGNKKQNGDGFISLYLSILLDKDNLSLTCEVNANFKFFIFDQIRGRYLTIQDADEESTCRFQLMKTEWGFAQLLSLDAFKRSSNGYLLDDGCVFGVEISVIKGTGRGESLSIVKPSNGNSYTFKIENYSYGKKNCVESEVFTIEGVKWKLKLYPNGNSKSTNGNSKANDSLSLYLALDESEFPMFESKLYAAYKLRMIDQIHGRHHELTAKHWFDRAEPDWGFKKFVPRNDVYNASKGYLVMDTMTVEAQFDYISLVKHFS